MDDKGGRDRVLQFAGCSAAVFFRMYLKTLHTCLHCVGDRAQGELVRRTREGRVGVRMLLFFYHILFYMHSDALHT